MQTATDKLAISLSLLCAVHCLALPLLVVALPSLAALNLDNEAFHLWMLVAVIPVSFYALTMGCRKHKRYFIAAFGAAGIGFLIFAVSIGSMLYGETGEKTFTVIGASMIAIGHFFNYRLCQDAKNCECHE